MQVSVIGLGYVGLVTSACLAEWGHHVTGVESNLDRLEALKNGGMPFFEPGLSDMVSRHAATGHLQFTAAGTDAVETADVVIVAVGTHDGNGGWQTETMLSTLSDVVPYMADGSTLVIRSTLPPDFIRQVPGLVRSLRHQAGRPTIPAMVNPEFTREGAALRDFLEAERVIFGIIEDPDGHGLAQLTSLYERSTAPVLTMSAIDAAFAKLGSNLFLATKISFANELAALCDAFGAHVDQVVTGMSYDSRIGGSFLRAGVGFGGSCLPNQVAMTVRTAEQAGIPSPLLAAVNDINHRQRLDFVERLQTMSGGTLDGKRVALLGLTFKPETDDLRDAPALEIARHLLSAGASVVAYDPMESARRRSAELVPGLQVVADVLEAVTDADAIGLVTEWGEFLRLDWAAIRALVRRAVVVDGRGALSADAVIAAGFDYASFGRGVRSPVAVPDRPTDRAASRSPRRRHGRQAEGSGREPVPSLRVE